MNASVPAQPCKNSEYESYPLDKVLTATFKAAVPEGKTESMEQIHAVRQPDGSWQLTLTDKNDNRGDLVRDHGFYEYACREAGMKQVIVGEVEKLAKPKPKLRRNKPKRQPAPSPFSVLKELQA